MSVVCAALCLPGSLWWAPQKWVDGCVAFLFPLAESAINCSVRQWQNVANEV